MDGDLGKLLRRLGLERYQQLLTDNDIDAEILPHLSDADLKELGLSLGQRKRFLRAIEALQAETRANEPARAQPAPTLGPMSAAEAERRQLTITFFDLVGSTEMSSLLEPEDMHEVVTNFQQVCTRAIHRYEGHVSRFLGDGILAFFGFPRAHEDDAERAVRAALEATEAVGRLRLEGGRRLHMRTGIATGFVLVGDLIGQGRAREETVFGEPPNLAARLQTLAEPGTVVIAPGPGGSWATCSSSPISGCNISRASPSRCAPTWSGARAGSPAGSRPSTRARSRPWSGATASSPCCWSAGRPPGAVTVRWC
jgi:class 3 adenylate cyclase